MRTVGLCVLAVFAISAVVAASAAAETFPSYKVCAKAPKVDKHYTGRFNQKTCTEVNAKGEGKYEVEPWTASMKPNLKGKGGEVTLDGYEKGVGVLASIACKKSTDVGKITGESTGTEVITLQQCTGEEEPCTSSGAKTGDIVTDPLTTTLVTLKEETDSEAGIVGIDVAGTGGEEKDVTAEFKCGTDVLKTTGSLLGAVTGDVWSASKDQTETFAIDKETGENVYNHELGGVEGEDVLVTEIKGLGHLDSGEQAVITQTQAPVWEIRPNPEPEPPCCSCQNPNPC